MRRLWKSGGAVGLVLALAAPWVGAQPRRPEHAATQKHEKAAAPLTSRERVEQLLDRFTYGPRPGEIDRVVVEGGDRWLAQQLDPASVPDAALSRRLAAYPVIAMSPEQALQIFPDRQQVSAVADGRLPMPSDPLQRSVMEVQVARFDADRGTKLKEQVTAPGAMRATESLPQGAGKGKKAQVFAAENGRAGNGLAEDGDAARARAVALGNQLLALPKEQRMAAVIAMPVTDRIALTHNGNLPQAQRAALLKDATAREREAFQAMGGRVNTAGAIGTELEQAHVLRDILSERQLETVMTDFWFNHFNVQIGKGADRWYTASYEREAIRPHALGKFGDLLLATATSPAMMEYLDNLQSVGPDSQAGGGFRVRADGKRKAQGLNENYGREVMELHTVGVDAGYTQADVTALAAILTGWGVERPQEGGPFAFTPRRHEPGAKAWFGYCIQEDGTATRLPSGPAAAAACPAGDAPVTAGSMQQGVAALKLLASSPHTAHFISYRLAQYFIADQPPAALVDRLTAVYLRSGGDIKELLRTIADSPEFNSRRYFRTKVKTPVEFLASAYRSTATDPQNPGAIVNQARTMGMPLYGAVPPTGYLLTADTWMNSNALVDRLNFAYQLSSGRIPNQSFSGAQVLAIGLLGADRLPSAPLEAVPVKSSMPRPVIDGGARVEMHATAALLKPTVEGSGMSSVPVGTAFATRLLGQVVTGGPISPKTSQLIEAQVTSQAAGETPGDSPMAGANLLVGLLLGSPEFQLR